MSRPNWKTLTTGTQFNQWYWSKEELEDICRQMGLPFTGRKFDLRDRIMYALDKNGKRKPADKKKNTTSKFNWARAPLTSDTKITDNVSFGPNFRSFMKSQIGSAFSCHSDFMDWVKASVGKTLGDAVVQWHVLEDRKKDPDFKREIADNNMYAQYTRDFLADNPGLTLKDASKYWLLKRNLPMKDGFVRYHKNDLNLS